MSSAAAAAIITDGAGAAGAITVGASIIDAGKPPDFRLAARERADEAVGIVDRNLHVSVFNAAAELIWGQTRAEVLGGHVSRLGLRELHREDGDDEAEEQNSEVTIERRDG